MNQYIELNNFIKINNLASTGGQAKLLIRSGKVLVNGVVEIRNKKKLILGDKVECEGKTLVVEQNVLRN